MTSNFRKEFYKILLKKYWWSVQTDETVWSPRLCGKLGTRAIIAGKTLHFFRNVVSIKIFFHLPFVSIKHKQKKMGHRYESRRGLVTVGTLTSSHFRSLSFITPTPSHFLSVTLVFSVTTNKKGTLMGRVPQDWYTNPGVRWCASIIKENKCQVS